MLGPDNSPLTENKCPGDDLCGIEGHNDTGKSGQPIMSYGGVLSNCTEGEVFLIVGNAIRNSLTRSEEDELIEAIGDDSSKMQKRYAIGYQSAPGFMSFGLNNYHQFIKRITE